MKMESEITKPIEVITTSKINVQFYYYIRYCKKNYNNYFNALE